MDQGASEQRLLGSAENPWVEGVCTWVGLAQQRVYMEWLCQPRGCAAHRRSRRGGHGEKRDRARVGKTSQYQRSAGGASHTPLLTMGKKACAPRPRPRKRAHAEGHAHTQSLVEKRTKQAPNSCGTMQKPAGCWGRDAGDNPVSAWARVGRPPGGKEGRPAEQSRGYAWACNVARGDAVWKRKCRPGVGGLDRLRAPGSTGRSWIDCALLDRLRAPGSTGRSCIDCALLDRLGARDSPPRGAAWLTRPAGRCSAARP